MLQQTILNHLKQELGTPHLVVYEIFNGQKMFLDFCGATVFRINFCEEQKHIIENELSKTCVDFVFTDVQDKDWTDFLSSTGTPFCILRENRDRRCSMEIFNFQSSKTLDTVLIQIFDLVGGVVGVVLCALLYVFLAPIIKIESKGPVIFQQERIGLNGRRFMCYKFRTMYCDAEKVKDEISDEDGRICQHMFKVENDKRITKIGKFLRRSSLDEFPQFLNVLLGQMSIVGTRPPTVDEWNSYEPKHRKRLIRKPGITGMWQVSGRNNITDFDEVVALDMQYIRNRTVKNYFKIIGKTFRSVKNLEGR